MPSSFSRERRCRRNGSNPDTQKIKKPRTCSANGGGEVHQEAGGPEGAVILLMMKQVGGRVYDLLDDAGNILRTITLDDFQRGLDKPQARKTA